MRSRVVIAAVLLYSAVGSTHTASSVSDRAQSDARLREDASARQAQLTATIEAVDKELAQAFVKSDLTALDRMYADSYVFTDPNARVTGKRELIDSFRSGAIKIVSQEMTDVKVQGYGTVAVETGRLVSKATRDGRDSGGTFRFTRVWVNRDGRWQTVAFQETRIPQGG